MPDPDNALNDAIAKDTMNKIIECIVKGKYSSACLLLLEATGYNPLHYIPYSTYNRLQKQQLQSSACNQSVLNAPARLSLNDLDYIEPLQKESSSMNGRAGFSTDLSSWHKTLKIFSSVEQTLKMETFEPATSLYFKYQLRG